MPVTFTPSTTSWAPEFTTAVDWNVLDTRTGVDASRLSTVLWLRTPTVTPVTPVAPLATVLPDFTTLAVMFEVTPSSGDADATATLETLELLSKVDEARFTAPEVV